MNARIIVYVIAALLLTTFHLVEAQQMKVHHVGIILQGGLLYQVVDGLKEGLKQLGLEEGKNLVLEIREKS